jgi:hypothetical protein
MFFKSAIEKIKQMFTKEDELMKKHEEYLHKATNGATETHIVINKKPTHCVCVYITPGSDIDHVMELYGKIGIKMHKHILRQGNTRQNILYIKVSDYAKLDVKHQKYFTRTTSNHKIYKQNLTYTEKRER